MFWLIFAFVNGFLQIYFIAEDTLKTEVWPTARRGLYSALVRVASLGGSIPVIFLSASLPISEYYWAALGIFAVGLILSVSWFMFETETAGRSVRIWS